MKINNEVREFLSKISKDAHKKLRKERPEYYSEIQRLKQIKATKSRMANIKAKKEMNKVK